MDLDDYRLAARQIAEYTRRKPKKYRNSGWKYFNGYFRGAKYGKPLVETGYVYYDTQAWANLKKCWKAFVISKSKGDEETMLHYAEGVMKFQKQLGLEVRPFPDLGLWDAEYDDNNDNNRIDLESGDGTNQDGIESYAYESEGQRIWRERIERSSDVKY